MKKRHRIYFTDKQKADIRDRWERSESMSSIGRLFERNSSSIFPVLAPTGCIRPPVRKRSRLALSLAEREEISRGLRIGSSLRSIARSLKRAPSMISREVARNGGAGLSCSSIRCSRLGPYSASLALQAGFQPKA